MEEKGIRSDFRGIFLGSKDWSREKLAVESGVSYNTIVKIEYGGIKNSNPTIGTLQKLANALEVKIDELLS